MLKLNTPIRHVKKDTDQYELIVVPESIKVNSNNEVLNFIKFLEVEKFFDKNIVDKYLKSNNINNTDDYYELFNFLCENKIVIDCK